MVTVIFDLGSRVVECARWWSGSFQVAESKVSVRGGDGDDRRSLSVTAMIFVTVGGGTLANGVGVAGRPLSRYLWTLK